MITVTKNQFRLLTFLPAVTCLGLLGYALYQEHVNFLLPCNLCILQRVVFIAMAVVFVLAAIKPALHWGRKLFGLLLTLIAFCGVGLSWRHVWMQGLPPEEIPDCGPGIEMMLEISPLWTVLKDVLSASGSCAEVQWEFLGLTMPAWTLICYLGFVLYILIWAFFVKVKEV